MIRNIDRIRKMSLEELASILVYSKENNIEHFDYEGTPIPPCKIFWCSPSGREYWDYVGDGKQKAINDCIKWLNYEWDNQEINIDEKNI